MVGGLEGAFVFSFSAKPQFQARFSHDASRDASRDWRCVILQSISHRGEADTQNHGFSHK